LPEPLIVPDRSAELAEARRCLAKVEAITADFRRNGVISSSSAYCKNVQQRRWRRNWASLTAPFVTISAKSGGN
jgi:hypothetical protein